MPKNPDFKKREEDRGKSLASYWPLISLILIAAAAGGALSYDVADRHLINWMHNFMGFFLCSFAMLKIFHPNAFADGFEMYDLLAKKFRPYAYFYPFIELGLGLSFFAYWNPQTTYILTVLVMGFGVLGVISALRRGLDINCPCMGSVLDVPLSTVTLTEDIGMASMAFAMLFMSGGANF